MIYETRVEKAIEMTENGQPYINPYDGCVSGCPFCYWLEREGWEGNIAIRINIAEILDQECERWPEGVRLYIGDYCDPYMPVEETYGLTRQCVEVIKKHGIPLTICTSAKSLLIERDLDLLRGMEELCIVTELCRLDEIEKLKAGEGHAGIETGNRLREAGLPVIATFAPIMPGITDLDQVLDSLRPDIPLYIDRFYMKPDSIQEIRLMEYLREKRPELMEEYRRLIREGSDAEYEAVIRRCQGGGRVRQLPF